MIPPEFIDDVLARIDIVEIIEARVKLKKNGQNYVGLCPFHQEKTPSFNVHQDKQFYYCFGCQATGRAVNFLMEFDRMDFIPAVEYLAQRVGMTVPQERNPDTSASRKRNAVIEILELSTTYFKEQLQSGNNRERAVSYLKSRGLSGAIARDFQLGFAPPGRDNLLSHLTNRQLDRQLLVESGMIVNNQEENRTYDRFRDRVMFPIRNLRGRTIAFGGRVISAEGTPKYLNSPETAVFHKSKELYGLYEARKRSRKLDRLIVVEGYMDVVALAQSGIDYGVATLGTATSREHVEQMFRLVPLVVFCFDGDEAGRNAAWKALVATLPVLQDGRRAKFLFLPDGEDPDTLVRQEGPEQFMARMEQSMSLVDYFFARLEADINDESVEGRAALSKLAVPLIRELPDGVVKSRVIDELSRKTGLAVERLISVTGLNRRPEPRYAPEYVRPPGEFADFDDSGQPRSPPGSRPGKRRVSSKLAERAITILLRQPEVAMSLNENELKMLYSGFIGTSVDDSSADNADFQLLAEMIEWVRGAGQVTPLLLLSHYQGQGEKRFGYLKALVEREEVLGADQLREEFNGVIKRLMTLVDTRRQQQVIGNLTAKPLTDLDESERQLLRERTKSLH